MQQALCVVVAPVFRRRLLLAELSSNVAVTYPQRASLTVELEENRINRVSVAYVFHRSPGRLFDLRSPLAMRRSRNLRCEPAPSLGHLVRRGDFGGIVAGTAQSVCVVGLPCHLVRCADDRDY